MRHDLIRARRGKVVWSLLGHDRAVADFVARFVRPDRPCHMAIAGGTTPRPILADLAIRPLPWNRVELLLTDERLVPEGSDFSNFRMISDAMRDTAAWVSNIERSLQPPAFDLVWLGMGEDGKIASYFAGTPFDVEAMPGVQYVRPDPLPRHAPFDRLTLNLPALLNAEAVILVIRGEQKRRIVDLALDGCDDLPISWLLSAATKPLRIFWNRS